MMANAHSVVLPKKMIRNLDWHDQINWIPVQSVSSSTKTKAHQVTGITMYEEIYVVTNKDKVAIGYRAIQEIISILPSTSWLTWFFSVIVNRSNRTPAVSVYLEEEASMVWSVALL